MPATEPAADAAQSAVAAAASAAQAQQAQTPAASAAAPGEPPKPAPLPLVSGESARYRLPDMHPEGRKFVAAALIVVLVTGLWLGWTVFAMLALGIAAWIAAFFRDPVRVTPLGDGLIISPADGLISLITSVDVPRQLVGAGGLEPARMTRISVFMSVFDVHVNRAPVAGRLTRIVYVPGKFLNADLDKASDDNERQYFVIEDGAGTRIAFTQIAGLVARRIMKWVQVGQTLNAGERLGLIRFGSRVDVFLPAGFVPAVAVGQRAVAGETILAMRGPPPLAGALAQ